jgi:TRAP-type mannitol/chloroaromatic compound transport system permease large subunit
VALYRRAVFVFALVMIVLGIALLARTASAGGGTVGYVIGALFVALGAARLTMLRKT